MPLNLGAGGVGTLSPRPMSQQHNPYAAPKAVIVSPMPAPSPAAANPAGAKAAIAPRFAARALDWTLYVLTLFPGGITAAVLADDGPHPAGLIAAAVCLFVVLIINWTGLALRGQTIGKRVMKVRVVRQDGTAVGFLHGVLLREWLFWFVGRIPGVGGLINLVGFLMIFGGDRRCLHDMVAKTDVICA